MRRKSTNVQCQFHPILTSFLFECDEIYLSWGKPLVITSGSEPNKKHGLTSLHYATPACAADIRTWSGIDHNWGRVPIPTVQQKRLQLAAKSYCNRLGIPANWIEIILEKDHIHIEYQPKRPA